jgi:hypothetical protein
VSDATIDDGQTTVGMSTEGPSFSFQWVAVAVWSPDGIETHRFSLEEIEAFVDTINRAIIAHQRRTGEYPAGVVVDDLRRPIVQAATTRGGGFEGPITVNVNRYAYAGVDLFFAPNIKRPFAVHRGHPS